MRFFLSSVVFFLLIINNSFATQSYLIVDIDKIVNTSNAYIEFKSHWDSINNKYQKEIESYENKIDILDKELSSKLHHIDEKKLKESRNLIGTYENKIRQLMQQRTVVLDKAMSDAIEILRYNISNIVREYAVQRKANIILSSSQVVYHTHNLDITQKVLDRLNVVLNKINIEIDAE